MRRPRGWCRHGHAWRYPADVALGLADSAGNSLGVQEIAALGVSKLPVAEASVVIERLGGVKLPLEPFTLATKLDAWNISERDDEQWGPERRADLGQTVARPTRMRPDPAPAR